MTRGSRVTCGFCTTSYDPTIDDFCPFCHSAITVGDRTKFQEVDH